MDTNELRLRILQLCFTADKSAEALVDYAKKIEAYVTEAEEKETPRRGRPPGTREGRNE